MLYCPFFSLPLSVQKDESLKTAREDLDRCQAELCAQREAFQKSYAQLRATLEEREAALKEKEDSNYLLRKDLLEVMTQFNQEKMAMEKRAQEQRARGQEMERALAEKAEEIARSAEDVVGRIITYKLPSKHPFFSGWSASWARPRSGRRGGERRRRS